MRRLGLLLTALCVIAWTSPVNAQTNTSGLSALSYAFSYPIGNGSCFVFSTATNLWTNGSCSGSASAGGVPWSVQFNNNGPLGGIALPGSTGTYCLNYTSLTAAPTWTNVACPGAGNPAFSAITTGTNTTATMTLGTGSVFTDAIVPVASTSAMNFSGAPFAAGTATTNFPLLYLNTTGATAPTSLSTGGTFLGINAPSGFVGNFLDAHLNGGSGLFNVNYAGQVGIAPITLALGPQVQVIGGSSGSTANSVDFAGGGTNATSATPYLCGNNTPTSMGLIGLGTGAPYYNNVLGIGGNGDLISCIGNGNPVWAFNAMNATGTSTAEVEFLNDAGDGGGFLYYNSGATGLCLGDAALGKPCVDLISDFGSNNYPFQIVFHGAGGYKRILKAVSTSATEYDITFGEPTLASSTTNIVGPSAAQTEANGNPILTSPTTTTAGQCQLSTVTAGLGQWGSCSGLTLQTNAIANASQSTLNLQNGNGVVVSNPSGGNVTLATTAPTRTVTGATDTVSCTADAAFTILDNNATGVTETIPQAVSSCGSNFGVAFENIGAGPLTLSPTTSTINGAATFTVLQYQFCQLSSDGTNYWAACSQQAGSTQFTYTPTGCTPSASAGGWNAGTITLAAGPCTSIVITLNGATGIHSKTGWNCEVGDRTAQNGGTFIPTWYENSSNTTTATIPIPAAVGATDVIRFQCVGY